MLGRRDRDQPELFVAGSLRQILPDDHILVRVDRVLDLSWLRASVADLYCATTGRPGIDPEVAVRLMLAGFLLGIVHDRRLLREAQVNLAIRWFVGYGLHEALPDHSSLTRIRQRWGAERFKAILVRTVEACVAAGIAKGEVVHIDASLVRADVTWDAIADAHAEAVTRAHAPLPDTTPPAPCQEPRPAPTSGRTSAGSKPRRVCTTDPDASLGKIRSNLPAQPSSKQHTAVDAACGVVLDILVTTGAAHESTTVEDQLDAVTAATGQPIRIATLDAGYAITRLLASLEARGIEAIVPTRPERPPRPGVIPVRRFKLDARHNRVRCPRGRTLRPHGKPDADGFQAYRALVKDCTAYPLRPRCFSPTLKRRAILLHKDHPALIRARRKHRAWGPREKALYASHRGRVEGVHGEAKTWHGLDRAIRRGLGNMSIQAYLTAAAINLKRLAAAIRLLLRSLQLWHAHLGHPVARPAA
ncbi:IS1182-like element ISMno32 family transposase [Methylobacterium nodulans]|uniref:Transposase IS4 family protein n=1 Tax=Methylobacterium nodulans (strain LMG 21967 / CNCM I-2342 / ORS 2060) TaxID=460265 RepID=B8IC61_METNO|nr:IS1182-like element ISMno32 family transposase [Methylobacterium nodulans]ACL61243.1 transposase IS4 family protein [Methylobacterium nodulans ORS 2060]